MQFDIQELKQSANLLKVLGNPYRLQIVKLLLNGEKNVSELNHTVKVSQPALSQHLSKLRSGGVLGARREQRQIYYFILNPVVAKLLEVTADLVIERPDGQKKTARA
jgi:ArsR family transcriptional regulator, virulence genes transcriptional regulator